MPPSREEVRVTTEALVAEAGKYDELGNHMTGVKTALQNHRLGQGAFFIGEFATSQVASNHYNQLHEMMSRLIGEGATEFHELAGALKRAADAYERTDGQIAADLSKIYGN